jgi:hypothetical protein
MVQYLEEIENLRKLDRFIFNYEKVDYYKIEQGLLNNYDSKLEGIVKEIIKETTDYGLKEMFYKHVVKLLLECFKDLSISPSFPIIWKHIYELKKEDLGYLLTKLLEYFETNSFEPLFELFDLDSLSKFIKSENFKIFKEIGDHYYFIKPFDYFIKILPVEVPDKIFLLDKLHCFYIIQQIGEQSKHFDTDVKNKFEIMQSLRDSFSHLNIKSLDNLLNLISDEDYKCVYTELKSLREKCFEIKENELKIEDFNLDDLEKSLFVFQITTKPMNWLIEILPQNNKMDIVGIYDCLIQIGKNTKYFYNKEKFIIFQNFSNEYTITDKNELLKQINQKDHAKVLEELISLRSRLRDNNSKIEDVNLNLDFFKSLINPLKWFIEVLSKNDKLLDKSKCCFQTLEKKADYSKYFDETLKSILKKITEKLTQMNEKGIQNFIRKIDIQDYNKVFAELKVVNDNLTNIKENTKSSDDINLNRLKGGFSIFEKAKNSFEDIIEILDHITDKNSAFVAIRGIGENTKYLNKALSKKLEIFQKILHSTSHLNSQEVEKLLEKISEEDYNKIRSELESLKVNCLKILKNEMDIANLNSININSLNVFKKTIESLIIEYICEILPQQKPSNIQLKEKCDCITIIKRISVHVQYLKKVDKEKFKMFEDTRIEFSKFLNDEDKEQFLNQFNNCEEIYEQLISIKKKLASEEKINTETNFSNIFKDSLNSYREFKPLNYIMVSLPETIPKNINSEKLNCFEIIKKIAIQIKKLDSNLRSKFLIFEELQNELAKLDEDELKQVLNAIKDEDYKHIFTQMKNLRDDCLKIKSNDEDVEFKLDGLKILAQLINFQKKLDDILPCYNITSNMLTGKHDPKRIEELFNILCKNDLSNDNRIINELIIECSKYGENGAMFRKFEEEVLSEIAIELNRQYQDTNYNFNSNDIRFILSIENSNLMRPIKTIQSTILVNNENLSSLEKFENCKILLPYFHFECLQKTLAKTPLPPIFHEAMSKLKIINKNNPDDLPFKVLVFCSIQFFNECVEYIKILEEKYENNKKLKHFLPIFKEIKNIKNNVYFDHYKYLHYFDGHLNEISVNMNDRLAIKMNLMIQLIRKSINQLDLNKVALVYAQLKENFSDFLELDGIICNRRREIEVNHIIKLCRQNINEFAKASKNNILSDKDYSIFLNQFYDAVGTGTFELLKYLKFPHYENICDLISKKENLSISWNDDAHESFEILYHLAFSTNSESKHAKFQHKINIFESIIKLLEKFQPISDNFELNFHVSVQQIVMKKLIEQKKRDLYLFFEKKSEKMDQDFISQLKIFQTCLESYSKKITTQFTKKKLEIIKQKLLKSYMELYSNCKKNDFKNLVIELGFVFNEKHYEKYSSLQEFFAKHDFLDKILDNETVYLNEDLNNVLIAEFDSKERFKLRSAIIFICGCVLEQNKSNRNILQQHFQLIDEHQRVNDEEKLQVKIKNLLDKCEKTRNTIFHTDPVKESNKFENPAELNDEFLKSVNILINLHGLIESVIADWKNQIVGLKPE